MIQVLCFSRDRPLQLHGYLRSLYRWWMQAEQDVQVTVLARSEPGYEAAYEELIGEFPQVRWWRETSFARDLAQILEHTAEPYWCFGCDDDVWINQVDPVGIANLLGAEPDVLGFSLRLGLNVIHGMWGQPQQHPDFTKSNGVLKWDASHYQSVGDWAYPWEVLGTVYRTEFVRRVVAGLHEPANPSQLEERGSRVWRHFTNVSHMAAMPQAPLIVPTINVVQEEFPNGVVGRGILSPELLLQCWRQGLRVDWPRFARRNYSSWRVADFYLRREP